MVSRAASLSPEPLVITSLASADHDSRLRTKLPGFGMDIMTAGSSNSSSNAGALGHHHEHLHHPRSSSSSHLQHHHQQQPLDVSRHHELQQQQLQPHDLSTLEPIAAAAAAQVSAAAASDDHLAAMPPLIPQKLEPSSSHHHHQHHHHQVEDQSYLDAHAHHATSANVATDAAGQELMYFPTEGSIAVSESLYPGQTSTSSALYSTPNPPPPPPLTAAPGSSYYDLTSAAANQTPPPPPPVVTTAATAAGQLVSYGGNTFLIQPSPDGGSPLITTLESAAAAAIGGQRVAAAAVPPQLATQIAAAAAVAAVANNTTNNNNSNNDAQAMDDNDDIAERATSEIKSSNSTAPNSKNPTLSFATRVAPATIQWLVNNYETAEGVSLPRSTLYSHYQKHCAETRQEPVNAASFGKLIRSVFLGLRTRRIGTRGNSKYHYYGIRVKPTSPLSQLGDAAHHKTQQPVTKKRSQPQYLQHHHHMSQCKEHQQQSQQQQLQQNGKMEGHQVKQEHPEHGHETKTEEKKEAVTDNHFGEKTSEIRGFPELILPSDPALGCHIRQLYLKHCSGIFDAVAMADFNRVEEIWKDFWSSKCADDGINDKADSGDDEEEEDEEEMDKENQDNKMEEKPKELLVNNTGSSKKTSCEDDVDILKHVSDPAVCTFIHDADLAFYQKLLEFLVPTVLSGVPNSVTQNIRNFAKNLEPWMKTATGHLPDDLRVRKLSSARRLSQLLRRHTGLNHLAQAARAVLQNPSQISQMLSDLNRVDFSSIQDQAGWVCAGCDSAKVGQLEAGFKDMLKDNANLEQWADWMKTVVDGFLKKSPSQEVSSNAKSFLLGWSFYSSMVIRDLTLRSAASFGSFHLIRLLFDEYMFYLVEDHVASVQNKSLMALQSVQSDDTSSLVQQSNEPAIKDDDSVKPDEEMQNKTKEEPLEKKTKIE